MCCPVGITRKMCSSVVSGACTMCVVAEPPGFPQSSARILFAIEYRPDAGWKGQHSALMLKKGVRVMEPALPLRFEAAPSPRGYL
jgi:hypothetical protein